MKTSLVWLSIPFVLLFIASAKEIRRRARLVAALSIAGLLAMSAVVSLSYEEKYPGGIVRRDHTATVISVGTGLDKHLYVNGQGITTLSTITKAMAHLPLSFFTRKPRTALTICFGMGTSYRSLLSWGLRTTGVELVPSVKKAFGFYHADAEEVLKNPLGHIVIDDGRRFLKRTSDTFDVVVIDPPPPVEAAGSSLLYSTEFYALLKKRMSPDAIFQQWFPGGEGPEAQAIARSLVLSFPYVKVYRSLAGEGLHFLASMQPLTPPTVDQFVERLPGAAKKDLLEWEHSGVKALGARILSKEIPLADVLGDHPRRIITDDHPYNEYYLLRRTRARFLREYGRQVPS